MLRYAAFVLAALVLSPAAFAGGNNPAGLQDNLGALDTLSNTRYVADQVGPTTRISAMSTTEGTVLRTLKVKGHWGVPRIDQGASLSFDGKTLVLAPTQLSERSSSFKIVDAGTLRVKKTVTLRGNFAFDALSPKAGLMYLVQYQGDVGRYIVRAVNLNSGKLLPGRIADKTQKNWIMQGLPVTRISSANGRFVYTLYANPGGYPFVHVLDTMTKTAHCVGIPYTASNDRQWAMRLSLRDDGKLAVNFNDTGEQYIAIDLASWKIDYLNK